MSDKQLASNADRDRVVSALRRHFDEGRLDQAEFERREQDARAARTLGDLKPLSAGLPRLTVGRFTPGADAKKLASAADRAAAVSKLERHRREGRIHDDEAEHRVHGAQEAKTAAQLDELLADLPTLGPRGSSFGTADKRADAAQREQAQIELKRHLDAGRLPEAEYLHRSEIAESARTIGDLKELFTDLPGPGPVGTRLPPGPVANARRRASNAQREAAIDDLRQHLDAGRLGEADFERRVERAREADTPAQLRELFTDLPGLGPGTAQRLGESAGRAGKAVSRSFLDLMIRLWMAVNGTAVVLWVLAGRGTFWPIYVIALTTAGLVVAARGVSRLVEAFGDFLSTRR